MTETTSIAAGPLRSFVKRRKMDQHERDTLDALIDLYETTLRQPQLDLVRG